MTSKIMNVFYGLDYLPYKDSAREVHYPILNGTIITGENNTRTIRFFVGLIGGVSRQWIANVKKPDGTLFYQLCSNSGTIGGEYYVELDISHIFSSQIGAVYIGLQGYGDEVEIEYDSETETYEISGNPSVIATGTIKILVNYSPSVLPKGETLAPSIEQLILGGLGEKLNITMGIISVATLPSTTTGYSENQVVYTKDTGAFYKVVNAVFVNTGFVIEQKDHTSSSTLPSGVIQNRWYRGTFSGIPERPFSTDANVLYCVYDGNKAIVVDANNVWSYDNGTWKTFTKETTNGHSYANEYYDGGTPDVASHKLTNKNYVDEGLTNTLNNAKNYTDDLETELRALIGVANGLATLDSNAKVPMEQLSTLVARRSESAYGVLLSMDTSTYHLTATLYDKDGNYLSASTIDLPLEEIIVSGSYDSATKKIILTLKNGQTIQIPIGDLISGLLATTDIVDNLTTDNSSKVLSAKQGKVLKDLVDTKAPQSTTYTKTEVDTIESDLYDAIEEVVEVVPTEIVSRESNKIELQHDGEPLTGQTPVEFKTINGRSLIGSGNLDNVVIVGDYLPITTKYGASISATMDQSTYIITIQLKDQDGNALGSAQTIDLPMESVVVSGTYDSVNKKIVLTLKNGNTIDIPLGDLVSGLLSSSDIVNNLNSTDATKVLSANQGKILKGYIDTNTASILSLRTQVLISQVPSATQGTITNEQYQVLVNNDKAVITLNNEIYYLQDKNLNDNYINYCNSNYLNNIVNHKTITINTSNLSWVLNASNLTDENGYYPNMHVGQSENSEQLNATTGSYSDTSFIFRSTGGNVSVGDRQHIWGLTGLSVVPNNLVIDGNFTSASSWTAQTHSTISVLGNVATFTFDESSSVYTKISQISSANVPKMVKGHYYYIRYFYKNTSNHDVVVKIGNTAHSYCGTTMASGGSPYSMIKVSEIAQYPTDAVDTSNNEVVSIQKDNSTGEQIVVEMKDFVIADITLMFGWRCANDMSYSYAHGGDERNALLNEIEKWLNRTIDNNESDILSTKVVSKTNTGVQQAHDVSYSNPTQKYYGVVNASCLLVKGCEYCLSVDTQNTGIVLYTDDYIFHLNTEEGIQQITCDGQRHKIYFTMTENMVISNVDILRRYSDTSGTATGLCSNLQINFKWNGSKDNIYHNYETETYDFNNVLIRGIPLWDSVGFKVVPFGDIYTASGSKKQNIGIYTFTGNENWQLGDNYAYFIDNNIDTKEDSKAITNVIGQFNTIAGVQNGKGFAIGFASGLYTTKAQIQAIFVSGKQVVYEKETPISTSGLTPYVEFEKITDWGTEYIKALGYNERTETDSTFDIPMHQSSTYTSNLRDKVQNQPENTTSGTFNVVYQNGSQQELRPLSSALSSISNRVQALENIITPTTWLEVQKIVRNGLAPKVFSIGQEIEITKDNNKIIMQVMGFDQETPVDSSKSHSMTLAMKYTFDGIVFDAREAFFYNGTDSVMSAGTYNFKMGAQSWYSADVGKYIQFTLTQDLPIGGQLVWQQNYNASAIGSNIKVFASGSILDNAPTEIVVMSEGQGGTYLGEIKNGYNTSGTYDIYLNHCQRALMGNNRWKDSAIRQWCNSNASSGSVWQPKNAWDRQPSWYSTKAGFLNGVESELVNVIGECVKSTEKASADGGGHETTNDKVWLLSRYEIQSCSQAEANTYPPYTYWHNLLGDTYGDWRTDTRFIKTNTGGSAQHWWLRSPYTGYGGSTRLVTPSGIVYYYGALDGTQAAVVFAII